MMKMVINEIYRSTLENVKVSGKEYIKNKKIEQQMCGMKNFWKNMGSHWKTMKEKLQLEQEI